MTDLDALEARVIEALREGKRAMDHYREALEWVKKSSEEMEAAVRAYIGPEPAGGGA